MTVYILYHANCQDGLGAKYAAWKKYGDEATYIPVQYGQEIPDEVFGDTKMFVEIEIGEEFYDPATKCLYLKETDVVARLVYESDETKTFTQNREDTEKFGMNFVFDDDERVHLSKTSIVFIVDFSYPYEALERLRWAASTLVILDHHKTAQEALKDFPGAIFDMDRSGAMIAWNYFHPDIPPPRLIECVQDRDLWTKKFDETEAISSALPLLEGDMELWDYAAMDPKGFMRLYNEGLIINRYKEIKVAADAESVTVLRYRGYKAGVRNYTGNPSDLGQAIYTGPLNVDFSMTYFIDASGQVVVSFRSPKDGVDVGALAKELKGGGHHSASGARVDLNFLTKLLAGEL